MKFPREIQTLKNFFSQLNPRKRFFVHKRFSLPSFCWTLKPKTTKIREVLTFHLTLISFKLDKITKKKKKKTISYSENFKEKVSLFKIVVNLATGEISQCFYPAFEFSQFLSKTSTSFLFFHSPARRQERTRDRRIRVAEFTWSRVSRDHCTILPRQCCLSFQLSTVLRRRWYYVVMLLAVWLGCQMRTCWFTGEVVPATSPTFEGEDFINRSPRNSAITCSRIRWMEVKETI